MDDIAVATAEKDRPSALDFISHCFPDETKRLDGRLWLPLHFALSIPTSILGDIQTLFAANPAAIKTHTDERSKLNLCHLVAMMDGDHSTIADLLSSFWVIVG